MHVRSLARLCRRGLGCGLETVGGEMGILSVCVGLLQMFPLRSGRWSWVVMWRGGGGGGTYLIALLHTMTVRTEK